MRREQGMENLLKKFTAHRGKYNKYTVRENLQNIIDKNFIWMWIWINE